MFREPSVDQEDKKDAPEPPHHSTGKHSFLSLAQIHTPIQRFSLPFVLSRNLLAACFAVFLSVHPSRQLRMSCWRLKEGFVFRSQLFSWGEQVRECMEGTRSNPANLITLGWGEQSWSTQTANLCCFKSLNLQWTPSSSYCLIKHVCPQSLGLLVFGPPSQVLIKLLQECSVHNQWFRCDLILCII